MANVMILILSGTVLIEGANVIKHTDVIEIYHCDAQNSIRLV